MIITIYRELNKVNDSIEEFWSISPQNKILADPSREVSAFIDLFILNESIPFRLLSIERNTFWRRHYYEWDDSVKLIDKSSSWSFKYIPFNGKKSCKKCIHYRKKNDIIYCSGRMKKIEGDIWKNCLYWTENSIIQRIQ